MFSFPFLLWYVVCSQLWLNNFLDDRHFNYHIAKSVKETLVLRAIKFSRLPCRRTSWSLIVDRQLVVTRYSRSPPPPPRRGLEVAAVASSRDGGLQERSARQLPMCNRASSLLSLSTDWDPPVVAAAWSPPSISRLFWTELSPFSAQERRQVL
jgi:hypothetical protein